MSIMTSLNLKECIVKIGSKGEIFPPKDLRESLGFHPNQPVLLYQHNDTLIVRKVQALDDILKADPKVRISYHALKALDKEINNSLEN